MIYSEKMPENYFFKKMLKTIQHLHFLQHYHPAIMPELSHFSYLPKSNPSNPVNPFLLVCFLPTFYTNTKSKPSPAHT